MPIAFSCSGCDKAFRVADEMAGKKAKCPTCATIMTVPAAGAVTAKPRPKASPPPTARSAKVARADDYDDEDDRDEEEAPARRAAAKAAPARRPAVDEDEEDDRPRRRPRGEDDAPDEDEEDVRPRKRAKKNLRKKSKSGVGAMLLLIGLIGGVLLLGGGGVVAWFLLSSSGPSGMNEAFVYAPDGIQTVVSARVEDLMKSQLFNTLKAQNPEINRGLQNPETSALLNKGVLQLVVMSQTSGDPVIFVKLRQPTTVDEMKGSVKGQVLNPTQVGRFTIHAPPIGEGFCLINSTTILVGNRDTLRRVLERNKKPTFSPQLERAVAEANWSRSVAFAVSGITPTNLGFPGQMNNATDGLEGVAGYVDVGSDVHGHITGLCRDNQAAEGIRRKIDESLTQLKALPPGMMLPAEFTDVINSIKVATSGTKVTGEVTISGATITKATNKPGGGLGGFPFNPLGR